MGMQCRATNATRMIYKHVQCNFVVIVPCLGDCCWIGERASEQHGTGKDSTSGGYEVHRDGVQSIHSGK